MTKLKLFFLFLFIIIVSLFGVVISHINIYQPVKIYFSGLEQEYERAHIIDEIQCFQLDTIADPISQKIFRLLIWNIHKGEDPNWLGTLKELVKNKDVVLLQEMTNKQNIERQFSSQYPTALYVSAFSFLDQMSGVGILSRFIPEKYCGGSRVEPIIRIPKVGSAVLFPLENQQSLLIINLHLVNFEINPTNYQAQLEQMLQLVNKHEGPIILAGDFNSWNKWRLSIIQELVDKYNLKEVIFKDDYRLKFLGNPLDFIFIRGFSVKQAVIEKTESSDHNPLLIELELQ